VNYDLPRKIKILDSGHFIDVSLNQMRIEGDTGTWQMRLRQSSEHLGLERAKAFHFVVLHALNGRRKSSTMQKWLGEFHVFTRSARSSTEAPISLITLEMFNRYASGKGASQQKLLRSLLLYWVRLKCAGVSDDLADYLSSSRSPKPRHTSEIQNTKPHERPFPIGEVRSILARIDELYMSGIFDPQDNLLWRAIVSLGLRPAQLGLLRVCDIRYESDELTNAESAFLNIPIVKQHGTAARSYMMEYRMSHTVTAALKQHLVFLEQTLGRRPSPAQPLFSISRKGTGPKFVTNSALGIASRINVSRHHIADALPGMEDSDLFTRRFKHTKLTHLAVLGAPIEVLARAGYQTSTVSLRHYVNLDEEAYLDYESRLGHHNQGIHDAFKGRIIEPTQAKNLDADHAVLGLDLEATLGGCAGNPCDVFAPVGCYICPRFEAFTDGDHFSVLRFLEARTETALRLKLSDETLKRDAHLIAAVKFVITEIEKKPNVS
jgi:integrase